MLLSAAPALVLTHPQDYDSEFSLGKQEEDGCTLF